MDFVSFDFQTILGLLLTLLFIIFYHLWVAHARTVKTDVGKSIAPPQPFGSWPIVGHLPQLMMAQEPLFKILGSMADKYGSIFMLRFGWEPTLVVSSSLMAKECFSTNDRFLATRPTSVASEYMTFNYAMLGFSFHGPYWREMRKLTKMELLSENRLDSLKHVIYSEIHMSIKSLYQNIKNVGHSVEMNQWFGYLTMSIILKVVVGKGYSTIDDDTSEQPEENRKLRQTIDDFSRLVGVSVASDAVPILSWLDLDGRNRSIMKTAKELEHIAETWLDEHEKRTKSNTEGKDPKDFMDVLLLTLQKDCHIHNYDRATAIKATSLALITAASDATSVTLSWALSSLLNDHHILVKAQDEIDTKVGKERLVEYSDLKNLVYLHAIIKETLRMYPANPLSLPHVAVEDCEVGGFRVQAGTRVLLNIWKLQRDPELWTKPSEFIPERFTGDKVHLDFRGQYFEYLPFGTGRRMCPGISFSQLMIQMVLARLLQGFNMRTPANEKVDMTEGSGLSMPKIVPLQVIFEPRLPSHLYT